MSRRKTVMSIAGSDPTAGAGIQQDIKACLLTGSYAATAITALTVQNRRGLTDVVLTEPQLLEKEIAAIADDIPVDAVKIGMTGSVETIETIARALKRLNLPAPIVDPVAAASSGGTLGNDRDSIYDALVRELFPMARLVTPNRHEAARLLGRDPADYPTAAEAAAELCRKTSARAVLLKGGHFDGDFMIDTLYDSATATTVLYFSRKTETDNLHGTGCLLSSAIASYLAQDHRLEAAVGFAEKFVHEAIARAAEYEFGII